MFTYENHIFRFMSHLEVILSGRCFRSLLSEYVLIFIGSCKLARNSLMSLGSFSRFMIWVTLAPERFSLRAISERVGTSPFSSIWRHFRAVWIRCFAGLLTTLPSFGGLGDSVLTDMLQGRIEYFIPWGLYLLCDKCHRLAVMGALQSDVKPLFKTPQWAPDKTLPE